MSSHVLGKLAFEMDPEHFLEAAFPPVLMTIEPDHNDLCFNDYLLPT